MKNKILYAISAVAGYLGAAGVANAAIIAVPQYSDVINTTSTAFGQSLFTDLLPWASVFILIVIAGLALKAISGKVLGSIKRVLGGGKKRGRRGRR
jgi:hypothetical protein